MFNAGTQSFVWNLQFLRKEGEEGSMCAYLPSPKLQEAEPSGSVTPSLENMDVTAGSPTAV